MEWGFDVQGGRFGKIGQWDVHIIEELNRNYAEIISLVNKIAPERDELTSNPILI